MFTMHDSFSDKGFTIAAAANECFRSFRRCIETASPVNPRELSMIEEQAARFRGWTTSAAVFVSTSASMDHHLRQYAPEVHSAVTGLLESLNYRCQECGFADVSTSTSVIRKSSLLTAIGLESLTFILESSEKDQEKIPDDALRKSLNAIAAEISRLDKISNTVRHASRDKQSLKASGFYVKDDKGNNAEETLLGDFHRRINHLFPSLGLAIQYRLARAMFLRQRQILYRKYGQGYVSAKSEDGVPAAKAAMPFTQSRSIDSKPDSPIPKSATTIPPQMNSAALSAMSASTTSGLWNYEHLIFPSTTYEQLKLQGQDGHEEDSNFRNDEADREATLLQLLHKDMQGFGEINCPYCLCVLPVEDAFDEVNWRNHVMDDLNSYVCVFEDCDRSNVMYSHRDQWLNHLQQHCKVWRCPSHRDLEPFPSSEDYTKHMREVHATKLNDKQLRMLANKISCNATLFLMCTLCGKQNFENNERIEDHVAEHLRMLAIESLPSYHGYIPAFDFCRLVALTENPQGCEGRKRLYIEELLSRAHPPIKLWQLGLKDYAEMEPKLFFSRARLNQYIRPHIDELLDCKCQECAAAKYDVKDRLWILEKKSQLQRYPWILGFMIYFGKLHFIYYWMKWEFVDSRGNLGSAIPDDTRLAQLIKSEMDRRVFRQAYARAISMFYPMTFKIQDNEICPYQDLPDSCRFPYLNADSISTNGFYRAMTKVEILPEHLDKNIIDLVTKTYPTPRNTAASDQKLLFAIKSVRVDFFKHNMERSVLDMILRMERPASENMIDPLFIYRWKDRIHFLFPYIDMNLDDVLRYRACPRDYPSKLSPDEQLSEHWLWREMKGVCCALSDFHRKMKNPFPDAGGIVIGLHFDLKPANILVTAHGKLKITDFGQSIIRIFGEGKGMAIPSNPGDRRYAAPESRPILDYNSNDPEDIEVLLNYDVWSLGCIMVEVLIHMLDLQTLEAFDQALNEQQQAGFFTDTDLKQCVNSALEGVRHMFRNSAEKHYMATITDLIRVMLSHDVKDRPYSWQVFDGLRRAETVLMDLSMPRDQISPPVTEYVLRDGTGFQELGWDNGYSIVPFTAKAGITVELVHQRDGYSEGPRPCRIRLFRKTPKVKLGPIEIAMVWGVARGGRVVVDQRKFQASKSCISPTYLFQAKTDGNRRFECRLFPIMGLPGQRNSYDLAFIFEFETLEDVLTFQGTLLGQTILPPIRATIKNMTAKRPGIRSKERRSPAFNQGISHVQLCAYAIPKHYKPTQPTFISRGSVVASTPSSVIQATLPTNALPIPIGLRVSTDSSLPSSITQGNSRTSLSGSIAQSKSTALSLSSSFFQRRMNRERSEEEYRAMIIFFEHLSPVIITLNDGHKVFKGGSNSEGKPYINIVNRRAAGHGSFLVRQLPAQPAWQSQHLNDTPHASSSILLEPDYETVPEVDNRSYFKMEGIELVLETVDDYQRLFEETRSEWDNK